jgi:hypothetical protein
VTISKSPYCLAIKFCIEAVELWDFALRRGGYARPLAYALDHVDGTDEYSLWLTLKFPPMQAQNPWLSPELTFCPFHLGARNSNTMFTVLTLVMPNNAIIFHWA